MNKGFLHKNIRTRTSQEPSHGDLLVALTLEIIPRVFGSCQFLLFICTESLYWFSALPSLLVPFGKGEMEEMKTPLQLNTIFLHT